MTVASLVTILGLAGAALGWWYLGRFEHRRARPFVGLSIHIQGLGEHGPTCFAAIVVHVPSDGDAVARAYGAVPQPPGGSLPRWASKPPAWQETSGAPEADGWPAYWHRPEECPRGLGPERRA